MVGAPRATYPGGLSLDDPLLPATPNTGLVYSCPLGGGDCGGVVGDTSLYLVGPAATNSTVNGVQTNPQISTNNFGEFFTPRISEGKLFDQARKCKIA